jgi:hypothetical protein
MTTAEVTWKVLHYVGKQIRLLYSTWLEAQDCADELRQRLNEWNGVKFLVPKTFTYA